MLNAAQQAARNDALQAVSDAQRVQRDNALQRANAVRTKRARIKDRLRNGDLTLEELLTAPPTEVINVTVGEVLEWLPGIGHWRCARILAPGPGTPGVGRMVQIKNLSTASKGRIIARYENLRPNRYPRLAA